MKHFKKFLKMCDISIVDYCTIQEIQDIVTDVYLDHLLEHELLQEISEFLEFYRALHRPQENMEIN